MTDLCNFLHEYVNLLRDIVSINFSRNKLLIQTFELSSCSLAIRHVPHVKSATPYTSTCIVFLEALKIFSWVYCVGVLQCTTTSVHCTGYAAQTWPAVAMPGRGMAVWPALSTLI